MKLVQRMLDKLFPAIPPVLCRRCGARAVVTGHGWTKIGPFRYFRCPDCELEWSGE